MISEGDYVVVKKPESFTSPLRQKITNRVGVVVNTFTPLGSNRAKAVVKFLKRNNRGKELEEVFYLDHLEAPARFFVEGYDGIQN